MCIHRILQTVWCWETLGFIAALLVLTAFYMKDMIMLRVVALSSNLAFMGYGLAVDLTPIWLLHLLLLPMNGCRLLQAVRARTDSADQNGRDGRQVPAMRPIREAEGFAAGGPTTWDRRTTSSPSR